MVMELSDLKDFFMKELWEEMEGKLNADTNCHQRVYRRLDLRKEKGIRLGCTSPGNILELLIEIGETGENISFEFPKWKGMMFEIIVLDIPRMGSCHIRLCLEQHENKDIFVTVCADLVQALEGCSTNESRINEITNFLRRWSHFFDRHGREGLSPEEQRGLYGELCWLRQMINAAVEPVLAVHAWKGCSRNYHDFEVNGDVVEVKTTMTKEPRKAQINNERQLDDHGLRSLHLFVLTLAQLEGGSETLPDLVQTLRESLLGKPISYVFDESLREAGYLDVHAHLYGSSYSVLKEELFHVKQGFPRIIDIPPGVGDIKYTITLATCAPFLSTLGDYLNDIGENDK